MRRAAELIYILETYEKKHPFFKHFPVPYYGLSPTGSPKVNAQNPDADRAGYRKFHTRLFQSIAGFKSPGTTDRIQRRP
ncbi:hypothetical protein GCM10027051_13250 [Niabella terrae]